jgi:hypothetical protein
MKFVSTKFVIGFYLRSQKKKQKIKEWVASFFFS